MAKILEEYRDKYIPTKSSDATVTLPCGSTHSIDKVQFHHILVGGDQLTVARANGAITLQSTHSNPQHCLHGVIPVIEDWHAKMTFMKVRKRYLKLQHPPPPTHTHPPKLYSVDCHYSGIIINNYYVLCIYRFCGTG